ncbi:acetyltransferase [Ochrobactrum phage vB_OspP_OH]|uniref:Acetyltransferase n=1 Tax=Ochrobactrum phage vB_OspP_OH TaxID=2712957 RepID=A0A6G6XXN0_9CAUD|nr:acetyltransferase [Ochrobactrum phage vB_OspP_OH]QIG66097.1 acetyltransferase [Ochrobactrum phage vB_OspP_OH]
MKPDADMMKETEKLLKEMGGLYKFSDIIMAIREGKMQSFSLGRTWVVTQVHEFPRRKVVDIVFVIGDMEDVAQIEPEVEAFAHRIGATLLMANGRLGWLKRHFEGWKAVSCNFVREI